MNTIFGVKNILIMLLLAHETNGDRNEMMKQHFVVICRFPPMVLPAVAQKVFPTERLNGFM